jgi:hypothetical protein
MNGIIGRSGTWSCPLFVEIFSPAGGAMSWYGIRLPL